MLKNRKGYIQKIRNSRTFKGIAVYLVMNLLVELSYPSVTYALTDGPSQPEVRSFEPIGTTQMVDLFSGDFNYNIPLFNLPGPNGGYPVNLAYHAGIGMDDEASWVGLGWNLNVGSLVRNMRGLPDEFMSEVDASGNVNVDHDYLEVKSDMRQSWTLGVGLSAQLDLELVGAQIYEGSASISLYYNNYKGLGVNLGASPGILESGNFSLGLSLDSENGFGVSPSLKFGDDKKKKAFGHKLSINFNGDLALSYSLMTKKKGSEKVAGRGSSSMSFASSAFSPSVASRINYYSIAGNIAFGSEVTVSTLELTGLNIFFSTQDVNDEDKKGRRIPVVGYDQLGNEHMDNEFTRDFMRQNDGQITKASVILPHSYYTYDSYVSTGQGLAGYFRPKRNDIGKVFDPYNKNSSFGVNLGFDLSGGTGAKLGVNLGVNSGWETQGPWENEESTNPLSQDFADPAVASNGEVLYYKTHAEQTIMLNSDLDYLGGLGLAKVKLAPKSDGPGGGKRSIDSDVTFNSAGHLPSHRFVRNTLIQGFTNKEVANMGEFNLKYFGSNPGDGLYNEPSVNFLRDERGPVKIDNHKAGFKVLNQDGNHYVYGLPAYNIKEVENLFSVPGASSEDAEVDYGIASGEVDYRVQGNNSRQYINKSTKSPYAHSFLLTSVLGADYIDLKNDGPTDDDMGYWVKFDYQKNSNDYQWRAPYDNYKAKYHRNQTYTPSDDMASYQYGEKELWYLARIETKSHIAIFKTSPRTDNREAVGEYFNAITANGDHGVRLDEILIYEKTNFSNTSKPLQRITFKYAESSEPQLCPGVPNGSSGKLTLRSISFNAMGSTRGELSQYEFEYAGVNGVAGLNPFYESYSFDGWGTYKQIMNPSTQQTDADLNDHFPYTEQFNQGLFPNLGNLYGQGKTTQQIQDEFASAWCLKQIKLPSGGKINIEYESDDYGYVQHKTAAQMFKIKSLHGITQPDVVYFPNEEYYDPGGTQDEYNRRIYFQLEEPVDMSLSESDIANQIYNDYVEPLIVDESGNRNLYFKSRMRLIKSPDVWDYVSGYLPLAKNLVNDGIYQYGCISEMGTYVQNGITYGTWGYVTVQPAKKKNGNYFEDYHPMALAAWTYLQTSAQDLLNNPNSFNSESPEDDEVLGKIVDIVNVVPMLLQSFGQIRKYCKNKEMAKYIDLSKSCIRLASPDKKKFGGGHRVKQISITDSWSSATDAQESSRTYGLVYEYTKEENGKTISSGVAQYEPQAIGDENALKYPVYFFGKSSIFTSNNLFTEAPVNEHLFPGASVGYSVVTTRSLNTKNRMSDPGSAEGRTGGLMVNEFYTARDFPTMVSWSILSENESTMDHFNVPIPIPLIGSIDRRYYHGTQAFLIETNDMHGKPKAVRTYEVNSFIKNESPITETFYEYQMTPIVYQGEKVYKVDSEVSVIQNDGTHTVSSQKRLMGVDVDLYTDQRQTKNYNQGGGLDINVDLPFPILPIPSVWPSFSTSKIMFRTFVTNKVVHRSGILKKTKTRDLQTVNEAEIVAYDERSGVPLLTKTKNEFGDDFYNYNIPAYYHYDRMGHAYKNINYEFTTTVDAFTVSPNENDLNEAFVKIPASNLVNYLVRGDELLVTGTDGIQSNKFKKAYFTGWEYSGTNPGQVYAKLHLVDFVDQSWATSYTFKIIRSGRRNHFESMAASYVTKGKPEDLLSTYTGGGLTIPELSNVVSANATVYKDDWATSSRDIDELVQVKNPFVSGNSGIWRPYKSYSYVGPRSGSGKMDGIEINDVNPDLSADGVMDNVPMFTWDIGNMENYVSNWEWVNEVTRYSDNVSEIENVNRLGIYSSALFGYDNSLAIAVGGNADMHELATMDFEMAATSAFNELLKQTNFNFGNSHSAGEVYTTERFDITNATTMDGGISDVTLMTNVPYAYYQDLYSSGQFVANCYVELVSKKTGVGPTNEGYFFNGYIRKVSNINGFAEIEVKVFLDDQYTTNHLIPIGSEYHGKLTLMFQRSFNAGQSVSYVTNKAHTGKTSMLANSSVTFEQPKIGLKNGKSYVLSMWISRDNTHTVSYEAANLVEIGVVNGGSFTAITPTSIKYGKIIEGWQKVDLEFESPSHRPAFGIRLNPGASSLYVDDVRLSPKTGGITSYVYDKHNFRLVATLNVDNYATLFFYDEEGNLTIKKQETERGIFTLSESRGHVSEN